MTALTPQKFVHALVFRCGKCSGEITAVRKSEYLNREQIARFIFELRCGACGWSGSRSGISAMGHAVDFDRAAIHETQPTAQ